MTLTKHFSEILQVSALIMIIYDTNTKGRFPLPEFTGRVDGPRTRVHFLTPVNSGRELG